MVRPNAVKKAERLSTWIERQNVAVLLESER